MTLSPCRSICKKRQGFLSLVCRHHFHLSVSLLGNWELISELTCTQCEWGRETDSPGVWGLRCLGIDFLSHRWLAVTWAGGGTQLGPQLLRAQWSLEARDSVFSACGCLPQGDPRNLCLPRYLWMEVGWYLIIFSEVHQCRHYGLF